MFIVQISLRSNLLLEFRISNPITFFSSSKFIITPSSISAEAFTSFFVFEYIFHQPDCHIQFS